MGSNPTYPSSNALQAKSHPLVVGSNPTGRASIHSLRKKMKKLISFLKPKKQVPKNRILWNSRPKNDSDCGDIDEIVIHNATVHIEQMDEDCWWIGIYTADKSYWMGNFVVEDGKLTFSEQENHNIEWYQDKSHSGE